MDACVIREISCNDKWLQGLVNAMEEVAWLRADDICRSTRAPAALMSQLQRRQKTVLRPIRVAA
ncbi:hypothetical protein X566_20660 [Afipia sp. P52-10]|jgi:hypothetical protein|nr:hypothetical protein X566_20660 [Afipia sp. P52-10]